MPDQISRRKLLIGMAALTVTHSTAIAKKLMTTPRQSAGPFYPVTLPLDDDNDLTHVEGAEGEAQGLITNLGGKILDINHRPLDALRIEIWQCDANGRYRHPHERSQAAIDENFQGHGHALTDADGQYHFRTIKPVPYPGRTPHIHIAVFPKGEPPFVTQLYINNEPRNENDFLFQRVPADRRHLVVARFNQSQYPDTAFDASFNIILNRTDGTPQEK
ncbi:MAG: intradiol ring-cleavage dioxygenase [Gammaproteobacteria bacterium]|nr:intradiol ring-cleavage dioxygenase [Gammaproteobacteria bacterium]NNJ96842.1 intradiol ring-cleavage dioxygenase [Gammaproteobacteria bacterium]